MRCFLISVIGQPNSAERKHADWLRDSFLFDVCQMRSIKVIRGDDIAAPGQITDQVVEALRTFEVAIADLTYDNLNVYYELGYRTAIGKPVVLIADLKQAKQLPFDIRGFRIAQYDRQNPADGIRFVGAMLDAVLPAILPAPQSDQRHAKASENKEAEGKSPLWWDIR